MDDVHHHKNELTSIKNPSQFTIFLNIDLRIHRKIPGQKIRKLREFTVFIQEKESVEELLFHFLSMNQISEDVFYQCKSREDFFSYFYFFSDVHKKVGCAINRPLSTLPALQHRLMFGFRLIFLVYLCMSFWPSKF